MDGLIPFAILFTGFLYWARMSLLFFLGRAARKGAGRTPEKLFVRACILTALIPPFYILAMFLIQNVILLGNVGWLWVLWKAWANHKERRQFRKEHPLPRFQYRLRDLHLILFCYGSAMSAWTLSDFGGRTAADTVPLLAGYFLTASATGFVIALDVLRRVPAARAEDCRFRVICASVILCGAGVVLGGLVAWNSWRKTLDEIELEAWRREKHRQRRQQRRRKHKRRRSRKLHHSNR